MALKIIKMNPCLEPFEADLKMRMNNYKAAKSALLADGKTLSEFANGHRYFGFHPTADGWYYREWAPGAERMYLTGDFCGWDRHAYPMNNLDGGVYELFLPGKDALQEGQRVMTIVVHDGRELERIPLYATRVVQDPYTYAWDAVVHKMADFPWTDEGFRPEKRPLIYECHIGMAQEEGKVGTYNEFRENILPRIQDLGYNTIQIMAVMEHPYYASFGYQVTNFFAASSRFGMPEDLKSLVNAAHEMGIAVLLDIVHSHASRNTREGFNEFDGTSYQFFHDGPKGDHSAWGTKCFNYGKHEVIHFLLSNLKFWMEEYHFDGFRFDGVTSMLYHDHGLGTAFTGPELYFSMNTDTEAVTYLQLASDLVREIDPHAILIAEDMSAMPGMCLPIKDGGIGFDYRLAMGVPDYWIKLIKSGESKYWSLHGMWHELTTRRPQEKVIGYAESHDQALVGDKTIIFRLADAEMYTGMNRTYHSPTIDRAIQLHKLIRFITLTLSCDGYLNFMGNEFGHPEWIDFPREGNGGSFHYARRQWSLADNSNLKYPQLLAFDESMHRFSRKYRVMSKRDTLNLWIDPDRSVMAFSKGGLIYVFNFSEDASANDFYVPAHSVGPGEYKIAFSTDRAAFGGFERLNEEEIFETVYRSDRGIGFNVNIPPLTAIVFEQSKKRARQARP